MNDIAQVQVGPRSLGEALTVADLLRHKAMIAEVAEKVMQKETHYGASFPGDKKQNLLKPGADALLVAFQLVPTFTVEERQFDGNHREYRITCTIKTRGGQVVAEGLGTCSTMETKYRYRNAKPECPKCGVQALMRSKFSPGWYCNPKSSGCGQNIPDDAVQGGGGKVENPDIADCWNTCLKIGKKRAQVDATITATGCSDMFTQDVEDMTEKAHAEESRHAPQAQAVERTPAQGNAIVEARPTSTTNATPAVKAAGTTSTTSSGKSFPDRYNDVCECLEQRMGRAFAAKFIDRIKAKHGGSKGTQEQKVACLVELETLAAGDGVDVEDDIAAIDTDAEGTTP